jgi:hypothetical protein
MTRTAGPLTQIVNSGGGLRLLRERSSRFDIARGNDGVVYDAETRRIYAANGVDAATEDDRSTLLRRFQTALPDRRCGGS